MATFKGAPPLLMNQSGHRAQYQNGNRNRKSEARPSGVGLAAFRMVREWGRGTDRVYVYPGAAFENKTPVCGGKVVNLQSDIFLWFYRHTHARTHTHSIRRYHMAISWMGMACEPVTDVLLWKQTVAGRAQCGEVVLQQGIRIPGRVNPAACLAPGPGSGCLCGAGGAHPSSLGSSAAAAARGWRQSPEDEAW